MSLTLNSLNRQNGLSMIESLVALVVVSVGLLGIAALQLTSMQQTASSHWHSQAVWYSYEMTDRISANTADPSAPVDFLSYAGIDTNSTTPTDCVSSACNSAQMIAADADDWAAMVSNLPNGRGVIAATGGNNLTVSVMWDDNAGESNCTNGEPATSTQSCYTVTITP